MKSVDGIGLADVNAVYDGHVRTLPNRTAELFGSAAREGKSGSLL